MTNLAQNIASLSPERRKLLERLLKKEGVDLARSLIVPQPRDGRPLPVSFAQQRLWFLDQFEPNSPFYNIPTAVRLTGALDVAALERALATIVERHEALRTTFAEVGGQPVQVIAPAGSLPLPLTDLSDLPPEEREAEVRRLATEEARRPFNLARGPLVRACLLRLQATDHVVLLTMHHIISDGWSVGVLVGEIGALYAAFADGRPAPLPALPAQYADYAAWQRQWLQGERLEQQLGYWKRRLAGPDGRGGPPALDLPADRPRPAVQTPNGSHYVFTLPKELAERLTALSQSENATLFMTLLAAFDALLYRYTGQADFAVGTPIANRTRAEIEGLIGFFVNTLVLRADLSGNPTFRDLLRRVRETALGAYAHQDLPFEMLVEALQPERDMSRNPLFQVMFVLQNTPAQARTFSGLTLRQVESHPGVSTFDLTLYVTEMPDGLHCTFEYSTDLFNQATMERMAGHFETLVAGIAADPDAPVAQLPLLNAAEQRRILVEWNATAVAFPTDRLVHELIAAQAVLQPDAIAVVAGAAHLTYAELNARANQLARRLRRLGVGPETLVGISIGRSLEMAVGLLGILKAGGAFVPLDPGYPAERLAAMIDDARPLAVLHDGAGDLPTPPECHRVNLADWSLFAQEPATELPASGGGGATLDSLAYVIYTSGSTGKPKGVMISHRMMLNHHCAIIEGYDLKADDRVLQFSTISFDSAIEEIFPTWVCGATLVLRSAERLISIDELLGLAERHALTVLICTTAFWHALVVELDGRGLRPPPSLRLVCIGGEAALSEHLATWWRSSDRHVRFINSYGPTEATITTTLYAPVHGAPRDPAAFVLIGRPMANLQHYILDRNLQPVPVGVPGELYIGGAQVARGYLNRPDLTAERFIPNPFAGVEHSSDQRSTLYKTGDLARYRPDGNIEFLGRNDFQVKVRGFRVELGEIEAALTQHPGVREAIVLARADAAGEKRLVAYMLYEPKTENREPGALGSDGSQFSVLDVAALREFLQARLPDYMLPSAFVSLDALPLTPSGKIDRRALPDPEWREAAEQEFVAPRTPVEDLLATIWGQLLPGSRVSALADFFDLGGHSLLATRLMSRVREAFQVELPLRVVFEAPRLADLAERIEIARRAASGGQTPPLTPVPRDGELPLSFGQQRLWFLDQLEPGSSIYNMPDAVRLRGRLDIDALRRSLNEIVRRHEALRTTFATVDGRPRQVIAPALELELPLVDLRRLPAEEREVETRRRAIAEAGQPFDLARGPLVRVTLLRLADDDHVALLTLHHIVSDGWSGGVLIRELAALYDAFAHGQSSPLPPLPIQYADYAAWQRQWLQGEALAAQLGYWRDHLAGAPPLLELPTDRPRPAVQSYRGGRRRFALPRELSAQIAALSRREGATLFMTLLAAFKALLHRYSGQEDIVVGTPIANRTRAETEGLIGFFINTLALRSDLAATPGFRTLLKQVRETALGAYAHQDVPFELIVDALQPERNLSHTPLFQVMFIFQTGGLDQQTARALSLRSGLTLSALEAAHDVSPFDLTLAMEEGPDGLVGEMEYCADLFDAATIERMLGHFERLLAAIVADPDAPVTRLPLLGADERRQLLVEWNATATDDQDDCCVHQFFAAQAARTPAAVAVVCQNQALTYAELNARANQLAHHLRRLGVGPETIVGLRVERSLEMVVAILGILKAGGAYLPLDPSYPAERIAFMLEDACPLVVIHDGDAAALALPADRLVSLADRGAFAGYPPTDPDSGVTPANLAYVIYTSGSTGTPKGVLIQHRNVVNHNRAIVRLFGLTSADRALQFATITFDTSVEELFPTWASGATLVLRPAGPILSGAELLHLIEHERISIVNLPTAYWHAWTAEMARSGARLPASVRLVTAGGEAATPDHLRAWWTLAGPEVRWLNGYGPTEATVSTTFYEPPFGVTFENGPALPIGRPLANFQLYILDRHLQPAPVGVPGELYIGGAGVARGYLNRPELTAERFIPNPFAGLEHSSAPRSTLYKTGDLARYLPDGTVEYLGRADQQVKIRGFRVEPGEIEAVLRRHPAVRAAVVIARADVGHKRLVAYVVPQAEQGALGAQLRDFLKAQLPDYMVPAAFVLLDALPLLPNGKLNRRALPAPEAERAAPESESAAPANAVEAALAAIWAEVLGLKQVDVHANFFELGGDSILSIQVVARANQAGLHITPRQLFEAPTVAGLAALAGTARTIVAEQGLVTGSLPLTPIQRWFFAQELPAPHHWNQSLLLEVREPLARPALEQAVAALLAHHDALRLRFSPAVGGGVSDWQQVNAGLDDSAEVVRWINLAHLPAAAQSAAITAAVAEAQASLDLERGPLLRVVYCDQGPAQTARLGLVVHHLAMDGVSWRVLLEDLQLAYGQAQAGAAVRLPPKTTSFQAWAQRLAEYAQSDAARAELDHWRELGQGWVAPLPVDQPAGANRESDAQSLVVALDAEATRALLHDVPPVYRTEINDVLLTALARALTAWTGGQALLVELEGHGREDLFADVDLSRTVGWFTTTYPVLLDLSGAYEPGDMLKTVKEQLRRVPNRGIGYGLLRYLSADPEVRAELAALPQPEVSFNYLGQFDQALPPSGAFGAAPEASGPDHDLRSPRSHLLEINGGIAGGCLRLEWTYSAELHRAETIEWLAQEYLAALHELIAHCQDPEAGGYTPSDFGLANLDQRKLDKVLAKFSRRSDA